MRFDCADLQNFRGFNWHPSHPFNEASEGLKMFWQMSVTCDYNPKICPHLTYLVALLHVFIKNKVEAVKLGCFARVNSYNETITYHSIV